MTMEIARLQVMSPPTDSEDLIGDAAKNQTARNPENTVFDAKRLIGRKFADPIVPADLKLRALKIFPMRVTSR